MSVPLDPDLMARLAASLTRPESLVLLAWLLTEKADKYREHKACKDVVDRMLEHQRSYGETLARIETVLNGLMMTFRVGLKGENR